MIDTSSAMLLGVANVEEKCQATRLPLIFHLRVSAALWTSISSRAARLKVPQSSERVDSICHISKLTPSIFRPLWLRLSDY